MGRVEVRTLQLLGYGVFATVPISSFPLLEEQYTYGYYRANGIATIVYSVSLLEVKMVDKL